MADIRIVKTICALSETKDGWQKELNIVSIDGGPFQYDIREWRLNHFDYRDGISLDEKEATELLINLRRSFGIKDSDLDVEQVKIDAVEQIENEERTVQETPITELMQEETVIDDGKDLIDILKEKGVSFIDKRAVGGSLWVIGGHELDTFMRQLKVHGFRFSYCEKGGKTTKGQSAWFSLKESK